MTVPGLQVIYPFSDPSLAMVGYLAERAVRRPFAAVLDSILPRPLGMTRFPALPTVATFTHHP